MGKYNKDKRTLTLWIGEDGAYDRRIAALNSLCSELRINRSVLIQRLCDGTLAVCAPGVPGSVSVPPGASQEHTEHAEGPID